MIAGIEKSGTMEHQDWTTVTLKKRVSTKDAHSKGLTTAQPRDSNRGEATRLSNLEQTDEIVPPKKRVHAESIQALIRKRMELGLTQEKADQKCSFTRHSFKDIESHKSLPTLAQHSIIQRLFGVQLKIDHI